MMMAVPYLIKSRNDLSKQTHKSYQLTNFVRNVFYSLFTQITANILQFLTALPRRSLGSAAIILS